MQAEDKPRPRAETPLTPFAFRTPLVGCEIVRTFASGLAVAVDGRYVPQNILRHEPFHGCASIVRVANIRNDFPLLDLSPFPSNLHIFTPLLPTLFLNLLPYLIFSYVPKVTQIPPLPHIRLYKHKRSSSSHPLALHYSVVFTTYYILFPPHTFNQNGSEEFQQEGCPLWSRQHR